MRRDGSGCVGRDNGWERSGKGLGGVRKGFSKEMGWLLREGRGGRCNCYVPGVWYYTLTHILIIDGITQTKIIPGF